MLNRKNTSLSRKKYKDQSLKLEDGVELKSRIWIPNGSGPWPTLLMRQPYGKEIASTITYPHPSWWAENGYLVVVQDVRGQGDSGGKFKGFIQEASDTTKTHKWVRSLKECNGKLGTYGFSYQGFTQLVALPGTQPPDCLAPAMTGLNEENHWSSEGGAFWWHLGIAWGLQLAALKAKREGNETAWNTIRNSLDSGSYLKDGESILKQHDPNGMAYQWYLNSNKSETKFLKHKPLTSWMKKPMLLIGGWWDPHLRGVLDLYQESISSGGCPEIHIGPATHLHWWEQVEGLHLAFFNKHLKGISLSKKQKSHKKLWNITTKRWNSTINTDNKNSDYFPLGLVSSGSACFNNSEGKLKAKSKGNGWIEIVHDPWRPVPSKGGHLDQFPGTIDRSGLDKRLDIAVFTSSAFKEEIYLEGIPMLEVISESDQKGFDLCVALSIVSKNQLVTKQISTGVARFIGKEASIPLTRRVYLQPICASIKANEFLRISISGSSWPAIGINPGNGDKKCGPSGPKCLVVTLILNLEQSKLEMLPLLSE